jgi:hypothetical protein
MQQPNLMTQQPITQVRAAVLPTGIRFRSSPTRTCNSQRRQAQQQFQQQPQQQQAMPQINSFQDIMSLLESQKPVTVCCTVRRSSGIGFCVIRQKTHDLFLKCMHMYLA